MARPTKAVEEKRDILLRVRFTKTEKQQLLRNAAQSGCNASDYVRLKSLDATPRTTKAGPERAVFIRRLAELGKIGSNINQIARALNRRALTGSGDDVPSELIRHSLHGVDTLSHHLLKLLGYGD